MNSVGWDATQSPDLEPRSPRRTDRPVAPPSEGLRLSLLKSQIGVEVEAAFQDVTAGYAKLIAARKAASVAREQLTAQEKDLAAGLTTVRKVLEAQDSFVRAEDSEIQALVDYGSARASLDAAQALSFETYGLVIQR